MGPNMKRLAIAKTAKDAIPDGGSLADGLAFLANPTKMLETVRAGMKFAEQSVALVRQAAEPNLWKDKTDEEIAGEILRQVEERKHTP